MEFLFIVISYWRGTQNSEYNLLIFRHDDFYMDRIALSWFPQLFNQFPILRPIIVVTEPYLKIFRKTIPPIAGFDLSALPAIFLLDILSQTSIAIGAEFPKDFKDSDAANAQRIQRTISSGKRQQEKRK